MQSTHQHFMEMAIQLSREGMQSGAGGPFGCVIVRNGVVVGKGYNKVLLTHDPTAHAEVTAIRDACERLQTHQLDGCVVYSSCEPCPMCLGAIYWAKAEKVYYANTREDAARIGFDDSFIYNEIDLKLTDRKIPFIRMELIHAADSLEQWLRHENKLKY
jgi:guanine deaminase